MPGPCLGVRDRPARLGGRVGASAPVMGGTAVFARLQRAAATFAVFALVLHALLMAAHHGGNAMAGKAGGDQHALHNAFPPGVAALAEPATAPARHDVAGPAECCIGCGPAGGCAGASPEASALRATADRAAAPAPEPILQRTALHLTATVSARGPPAAG